MLSAMNNTANAIIPASAVSDSLFAKGYLNVIHYGVVANSSGNAASNTTAINQAIQDAYNRENNTAFAGGGTLNGSLALYFPPGTYWVNNTLKAHTATGNPNGVSNFDKPKNHLNIVGSTSGASRPVIKLVANASGFGNVNLPKHLLEFLNWKTHDTNGSIVVGDEQGDEGYNQMLRGVDLNCNGNSGCIALYFNNAQNSSVENINITATGSHTGIKGTAGPGVMVNIQVTGGKIGIDTTGFQDGNIMAGTVITGLKLIKQVDHSVIHNGYVPLTIAGFEIVTPDNSTRAALTIQSGYAKAFHAGIALIDGIIRLGGEPSISAINNSNGKNFYARNVYITPSGSFSGNSTNGKLIKSASNATITGNGNIKLINEYNYTIPNADTLGRLSRNLIEGVINSTEYPVITSNAGFPPTDLVTRHAWIKLPSVNDSDAYDIRSAGINPGTDFDPIIVNHTTLQNIINTHPKVFLPKGIYQLTGPITLNSNTVLYGAGRGLTRIEVDPDWSLSVTTETPIIQTVNTATATTYLGDLSIGVDTLNEDNDWYTALLWKAGASSMVHIGQVYRSSDTIPGGRWTTNAHSLIKITGNGGGRWYATGAIKTLTSEDPGGFFRILKVENTTQPLWFYSLNPEHPRGIDTYMEFNNADNVRIYGIKSEYTGATGGSNSYTIQSSVMKVRNGSQNVAIFGHGSLRNGLTNKGAIEMHYSSNCLAALILPQADNISGIIGAKTIKEVSTGTVGINYPDVVTLYKKGTINDTVMVHSAPSY